MDRAPGPVLLLVLLTLCMTAGTPEVWVQVQMEDAQLLSFTIRCGFLGSGSISLVTVSCGGTEDAGRAQLAVLHPKLGTQLWPPTRQAHFETRTSILLTLEASEGRSPSSNTTFCCKFISYPEGSQEACENLLLDKEGGLPIPTAVPILRPDLAGIMGVSVVLLFGCICLLYLIHRQRHWSIMKPQPLHSHTQTQRRARMVNEASLASLHILYATVSNNYIYPPNMSTVPPPRSLSWRAQIPTQTARQAPAPWAPLTASAHHSFVSMENGLYYQAEERPLPTRPTLLSSHDPLGPRTVQGRDT